MIPHDRSLVGVTRKEGQRTKDGTTSSANRLVGFDLIRLKTMSHSQYVIPNEMAITRLNLCHNTNHVRGDSILNRSIISLNRHTNVRHNGVPLYKTNNMRIVRRGIGAIMMNTSEV